MNSRSIARPAAALVGGVVVTLTVKVCPGETLAGDTEHDTDLGAEVLQLTATIPSNPLCATG